MHNNVIKVLLVGDDEDDYVLTRNLLFAIESGEFRLTWAATYREALEAMRGDGHDVCLVNYRLGERNGVELLREARACGLHTPAILLTAAEDHAAGVEAAEAGAADYLVKGQIDRRLLERSIRYALERSKTLAALREAERRAVEEYERLLERAASLGQALGTAHDLTTIYRALSAFVLASMPCSMLLLSLLDREKTGCRVVYLWSDGQERDASRLEAIPAGSGLAAEVIKTGRIIVRDDCEEGLEGRHPADGVDAARASRPRSVMLAPLAVMGRILGVVEIHSRDLAAYGKGHVTAVRLAANLAATAIENEQLLEQERERAAQLLQSQKMEAVGRLAGGMAHDFNNLLTAITGYSDLSLRRLAPGDQLHRNIEEIKRAAERASALTYQLLAFSRKQVLQPRVLDLNAVISEMDKMLHRMIGEDLELLFELAPSLGSVKADPGQIQQVLMNLVVNARDAMPGGGRLTIQTANVYLDEEYARQHVAVAPGPHVMLAVSDTGCGMDAATQARIFEPFFTTKEQGKGTGLGLSTVYGIVRQSQGSIRVHSEAGRGATFRIFLPRAEGQAEKIRLSENPRSLAPGTETILLVEDDEMVRGIARTILRSAGYTVLEAADGESALGICGEHQGTIHLMLTDVVMPRISGRQVANRVKELRPEMRTLFMSGYTEEAITLHGIIGERDNFMEKPFTPESLTRKVRAALNAPA